MKIGFIGLGIMGRPMALNLKSAGHELFVPDRRSLTDELRASREREERRTRFRRQARSVGRRVQAIVPPSVTARIWTRRGNR